jgi:hypothetical protein
VKKFVILAVLLSVIPMLARAQSVPDQQSVKLLFEEFGLIGVWARSCSEPASLSGGNPHTIYSIARPDGVMLTYDNGPDFRPSIYNIVSAKRIARDRLTYVEQRFNDKVTATVTVVKQGNLVRVWESVAQDGRVLIKDGKFATNGSQNMTQARCGT